MHAISEGTASAGLSRASARVGVKEDGCPDESKKSRKQR